MSRRLIKREAARREMLDQFAFIHDDNPSAANRYVDAAETTFRRLLEFPGIGRLWVSDSPHLANVRVTGVRGFRNYRVFYRSIPDGIEILHVIHGARDIPTLLEGEETGPDDI